MSSELRPIGEVLVSLSAAAQTTASMSEEYAEIHREFMSKRDPEMSYIRMAWLCCRAIEKAIDREGEPRV